MLAACPPTKVETGVPDASKERWTGVGPHMSVANMMRKDILLNFSIVCIDLESGLVN
jgi:hypothetical protein